MFSALGMPERTYYCTLGVKMQFVSISSHSVISSACCFLELIDLGACCFLAGPDLWMGKLSKCPINMVFTYTRLY